MSTVVATDDQASVTWISTNSIDFQNPHVLDLMVLIHKLHTAVPCQKLTVKGAGPNVFRFEIDCVDGRKWKQRINITTPVTQTAFNGSPTDFWADGEILFIRDIRVRVNLLLRFPWMLQEINAIWPWRPDRLDLTTTL